MELGSSQDEKKVRSEIVSSYCSYTWALRDFSKCELSFKEYHSSEVFFDKEDSETRWQMLMYPNGLQNEGWMEVCLKKVSSASECVSTRVKLWLVTTSEQFHFYRVNLDRVFDSKRSNHVFLKFACRSMILKKLQRSPDDTLRLGCELTTNQNKMIFSCLRHPREMTEIQLSRDVREMLSSGEFADAVLKTRDKSYRVHKAILSCRSPAFCEMFKAKDILRENDISLYIIDFKCNTMDVILDFIYSGKCSSDINSKDAVDLYKAAVRYHIEDLMVLCTDNLISNLSVDTVIDVLSMAETHKNQKLKTAALNYCKFNYNAVTNKKQWGELTLQHPKLVKEISSARVHNAIISYL